MTLVLSLELVKTYRVLFFRLSMRCVFFELAGGAHNICAPPPPGRAKVAQTPAVRGLTDFYSCSWLNTRTGGRGAKNALHSGFSRIAEKRRRAAPPFFQYLLRIELDILCKNFHPRSPMVRSPGQVKVKNGFLTLRLRSGHTRYPIGFKPSVFHKMIDTCNLYISDF